MFIEFIFQKNDYQLKILFTISKNLAWAQLKGFKDFIRIQLRLIIYSQGFDKILYEYLVSLKFFKLNEITFFSDFTPQF